MRSHWILKFLASALAMAAALPVAQAARPRAATAPHDALPKMFRADLVEPGKTQGTQLRELLGKPVRAVQESPHRTLYFYDLGEGASMDATVSVHAGTVEYVSYLCNESLAEIRRRYASGPTLQRAVEDQGPGYTQSLSQLIYEDQGRGFIVEPRTGKVRACMVWEAGKKFADLGR